MSEAPPKGYRPEIPVGVKFNVVMRQDGRCQRCGEKLQEWRDTQFDHRPPIHMRTWSAELGDTLPAANDVEHLEALHRDCHKARTTGRQGESKLSKRGGDISDIAKLRRLTKKEEDFRKRLLTKGDSDAESEDEPRAKRGWAKGPKRSIPSRPFPKRRKEPP